MRFSRCLFGLQQVFGEPLQHLLLQKEFIHGEGRCLKKARGDFDHEGLQNLRHFCWRQVDFSDAPVADICGFRKRTLAEGPDQSTTYSCFGPLQSSAFLNSFPQTCRSCPRTAELPSLIQ